VYRRHLWHRMLVAAIAVAALAVLMPSSPAAAAAATPPVPAGLPAAADPFTDYVPASGCDSRPKTGTVKLLSLLQQTYPGVASGTVHTCLTGTLATSEHYDGRAIDFMLSIRNATQMDQVTALVNWLLATDANGQAYANARRLGVMYLVWNDHIWGAYSADMGWRPYGNCANTPEISMDATCHRNHIHLSLSWNGAMGRTSFWTMTIPAADYGPCRAGDLNWADRYSVPRATACPRYARLSAPAGSSTVMQNLVKYSGINRRLGEQGPVVSALQAALGVTQTGTFDSATDQAVRAFKAQHGLTVDGVVGAAAWRALLATNAP